MVNYDSYGRLFDLSGKRAVVIGAGSGIGEAGALALAAQGAEVLCADLSEKSAARVAAVINDGGGHGDSALVDVSDGTSVAGLLAEFGDVDVLVTTPAINVRKPMLQTSPEEVAKVLSINLVGTFNTITSAGRAMAASGGGSIIAISSIRSQVVEPG
jgi:NAD(P)-dependent dehydrogenase (short-subunit alcohol dehydrogenase family)